MSVCSPCFDSGIIVDACLETITFGFVTEDTEYTIDVQHNATRKIQTFVATSDATGMLSIQGLKVDPLQGYTISLRNCETFTICEQTYTCISFSVVNSNVEAGGTTNLIECVECEG